MNLAEIEARVADLDVTRGFDFVYDLLLAYGLPKASIDRLRKGSHNLSKVANEVLWRGKVFYRFVEDGSDLHALIDESASDPRVIKSNPRFLIVTDGSHLVAADRKRNDTLDTSLLELPSNVAFFLPWAGIEKAQLETLNYADIKAAERMARLYDEIIKVNGVTSNEDVHQLNVFFSRLLFCFFAEDTGVFHKGLFTNAVASLTNEDGQDLGGFLDSLFSVLNTPADKRHAVPAYFRKFGYVNGKLFDQPARSPRFSLKARKIVLESGTLDWSRINPDIFGSMIQAVVHPGQREGLGMHYTSVENIMKVIRPLFLDDLDEAFERALGSVTKLERVLERISAIKVFDPACGSGNFLVIAYKEIRKLEHRILERLAELEPSKMSLFKLSRIKLENFYGIEIDDFAHEIAILSLWLAKHQMNIEFGDLFGVEISLIPLQDTGSIICGNAARLDWVDVCPRDDDGEVYLCSNPPYRGAKLQSAANKSDLEQLFGGRNYPKNLDYVSIWFLKGADYIRRTKAELAFVTTNSVCQGNHVGLLWPLVFQSGSYISFAHQSFTWTNQAKGNAGVTCIIVGLSIRIRKNRFLYSAGTRRSVPYINAYLRPSSRETIVLSRSRPLSALLPDIREGSRPNDGGHLVLTPGEKDRLLSVEPNAAPYIRRYMGSREFINGIERYCLWIPDRDAETASKLAGLRRLLDAVRTSRLGSGLSAKSVAERPYRFDYRVHQDGPAIIIPSVSSERRTYIPMGFLDGATVVSNLAYVVYGALPWLFGVLQSRLHVVWVDAVGGRMKTDYRYSGSLCYNTFPVPNLTDDQKTTLADDAFRILDAREQFPENTIAGLYDPSKMPEVMRRAHRQLDETVDRLYRAREFTSDDDRLELLFDMYETLIAGNDDEVTLAKSG